MKQLTVNIDKTSVGSLSVIAGWLNENFGIMAGQDEAIIYALRKTAEMIQREPHEKGKPREQ